MAVSRTLTVEVRVLHEYAKTGVWCNRCALPSAITFPVVGINPKTLRTVFRGTVTVCHDCGERIYAS